MPFCTKCGGQVTPADVFCGKCGARQREGGPAGTTTGPQKEFLGTVSSRTASLLCYIPVLGWIPSVIVLAAPRFQNDRTARFHAFQGLYLFVIWLMVDWVVSPFIGFIPGPFGGTQLHAVKSLLHLGVLCAWIFMLVKTSQDQAFRLPIVGELAEKSLSEQR